MNVAVYGKSVPPTKALQEYIQKKLYRLDKYLAREVSAQVTLGVERGRHIVEVMIPINGFLLRGEEATDNMYASMDLVVDKLEKQVIKYKGRFSRRRTAPVAVAAPAEELLPAEDAELEDVDHVVKVKRFPMKPQTVDEAIMQMNLLGHDFYMFTNAETENISVVYRRNDGNYGLIEPEL